MTALIASERGLRGRHSLVGAGSPARKKRLMNVLGTTPRLRVSCRTVHRRGGERNSASKKRSVSGCAPARSARISVTAWRSMAVLRSVVTSGRSLRQPCGRARRRRPARCTSPARGTLPHGQRSRAGGQSLTRNRPVQHRRTPHVTAPHAKNALATGRTAVSARPRCPGVRATRRIRIRPSTPPRSRRRVCLLTLPPTSSLSALLCSRDKAPSPRHFKTEHQHVSIASVRPSDEKVYVSSAARWDRCGAGCFRLFPQCRRRDVSRRRPKRTARYSFATRAKWTVVAGRNPRGSRSRNFCPSGAVHASDARSSTRGAKQSCEPSSKAWIRSSATQNFG